MGKMAQELRPGKVFYTFISLSARLTLILCLDFAKHEDDDDDELADSDIGHGQSHRLGLMTALNVPTRAAFRNRSANFSGKGLEQSKAAISASSIQGFAVLSLR